MEKTSSCDPLETGGEVDVLGMSGKNGEKRETKAKDATYVDEFA